MSSPKKKQQGPGARKHVCGRCGVLRWTEQFAGVGVSKLTRSSVCDLCKMEARFAERLEQLEAGFQNRASEIERRYEARLAQMEKELESLRKGAISSSPASGIGRESKSNEDKEEKNLEKKKKKKKKKKGKNKGCRNTRNEEGKGIDTPSPEGSSINGKMCDIGNGVKGQGNDPEKKDVRVPQSPEVFIFGDSQTRGLQPLMAARLHKNVKVRCLPGRGNKEIRVDAEKTRVSETSVVAVSVSGNDLYLRNGRVGPTEKIISEVMGTVDDCRLKTRKRAVIGMLPRRGPSWSALSRNISINQRLADLCTAEGVFFVDPYSRFYGKDDLYQRDGIHLSLKGKAELSNMITDVVKRTTRANMGLRTFVSSRVSPDSTFAEVLSGKKNVRKETSGNGRD